MIVYGESKKGRLTELRRRKRNLEYMRHLIPDWQSRTRDWLGRQIDHIVFDIKKLEAVYHNLG